MKALKLSFVLLGCLFPGTAVLSADTINWTVTTTSSDQDFSFTGVMQYCSTCIVSGPGFSNGNYYYMHQTFNAGCIAHTDQLCRQDIPTQSQMYPVTYQDSFTFGGYDCDVTVTHCQGLDGDGTGNIILTFASSLVADLGPVNFSATIYDYHQGSRLPSTNVSGFVTPDSIVSSAPEPGTAAMLFIVVTAGLLFRSVKPRPQV